MTTISIDTSALVPNTQANADDVKVPLNELKTALELAIDGGYPFNKLVFTSPTTLEIVGDSISCTQARHLITTEGGIASDNLETISFTGDLLILELGSPNQAITIKHDTANGNIITESGHDFVLDSQNAVVFFVRNAVANTWFCTNVGTVDLWLKSSLPTTISSGTIAASQSRLLLLAESGAVDDLATIVHSSVDIIFLYSAGGHTITLKHGTGNIYFQGEADYQLSSTWGCVALIWNPTDSKWVNLLSYAAVQSYLTLTDVGTLGTTEDIKDLEVWPGTYEVLGAGEVFFNPMPRPGLRKVVYDTALYGTTFKSSGPTFTTTGSVASASASSRHYIRISSAASIGSYAARRSGSTIFQWRWSPSFDAIVASLDEGDPANGDNHPIFFGMIAGTPTVAAGPLVTYDSSFYGVVIKPYASGGYQWAGQVWQAGVKLGQVLFGTTSASTARLRFWVDAATSTVTFDANGERSAALPVTVGVLATTGLDLFVGIAAAAAASVNLELAVMYGDQD